MLSRSVSSQAANYLNIPHLLRLVCAQFACHLADRGPRAVEQSVLSQGIRLVEPQCTQVAGPAGAMHWSFAPIHLPDGTPKTWALNDIPPEFYEGDFKRAHKWAWDTHQSADSGSGL
jgi:hypothetical protein